MRRRIASRRARKTAPTTLALALTTIVVLATRTDALKANDFKTCATSSFCARRRDARDARGARIEDARARERDARAVEFDVVRGDEGRASLVGSVEGMKTGAVRVRVDERGERARFAAREVLTRETEFEDDARARARVVGRSETSVEVEFEETGARAKIYADPFKVEVYAREATTPAAIFNARGEFAFETGGDGSSEDWAETFNGHTDTRKNGPTAVAFDLTFPSASDAYGLPERATSLSLKSTRKYESGKSWFGRSSVDSSVNETTLGEPYRLYNLDVFEYLDDSAFGLYGSIPMLTAHGVRDGKSTTAGAYFHNPSEMYVDVNVDGANGVHTKWMAESGAMDVFILPGDTPADVLKQYTALTGTTSMPPLFSLGYHQCRWNYRDENDVKEVDAGFDANDIPYDVLWLDIEHTDGKRYMTWDNGPFPTPERMINDIASRGRKMVTIVDPHVKIDNNYPVYKEAKDKGFYVKKNDGTTDFDGWCWPGSSTYLDVTNPDVREWWASKFSLDSYKGSTKDLYIWNDMNEPSVFNGPEITMQKDLIHHGGVEHREVHNAFGMYYHMATAEGIKRRNDGDRPFVLSRAFFAGTQRIGPIWTGDNTADWRHLAVSLPMVLTLGVSGLTFSGADVGGFFGNPDAELMTRWYQVGTYYPFFRGHAHLETKRREPWLFGDESTAIIRQAIRERYALLPYIYTLFEESHRTGAPVLRPLWYEFPTDENVFKIQDSFMLGSAILVQPVLKQGAKSVSVYLPAGVWYEKRSGARHVGPKTFDVSVELSDVPVFLRGGTIFVRKDRARRSSTAMKGDPLTIVVALDANGEARGSYYADDGKSYEYEASKSSAFARRSLSFKNGHFVVSAASDADGGAGNVKSFVDETLIERVSVYGSSAAAKSATCSTTGDTFDVVARHGEAMDIRRPNLSISQDFTLAVR